MFKTCSTERKCTLGPFLEGEDVVFGLIPLYQGTVTLKVRTERDEATGLVCSMPGPCQALASGSVERPPYWIDGTAPSGSVGSYVVWVTYG